MTILDAEQTLSAAQAISGAGNTLSANVYDTKIATSRYGAGNAKGVAFSVITAADAASGDETYTFNVVTANNSALSSPTVIESVTIPRATLAAGYRFFVSIPPHADVLQYLGVQYVLGGTTPSITISADLVDQRQFDAWKAYPTLTP